MAMSRNRVPEILKIQVHIQKFSIEIKIKYNKQSYVLKLTWLNDMLLSDDKFLKRKIRHLSKTPIHHVSDALRLVAIYRWFIFSLLQ